MISRHYIQVGIAKGLNTPLDIGHWGPWKAILISMSILVGLVAFFQIMLEDLGSNWPLSVSIVSMFWFVTYFVCSYKQFKTLYLFSSTYIIPLSLFHLGVIIPQAFGWVTGYESWAVGPFAKWLGMAGWYAVLTLACIGFGYGMSWKKSSFKPQRFVTELRVANRNLSVARWDGLGLLIAAVFFLSLAFYSMGNLLNYSRADFFHGVGDSRGLGGFLYIGPSAAILLAITAQSRSQNVVAAIISFLMFAVILLSGYRTHAFFPLLVGTVLWVKLGRKIPPVLAITVVFFVIVAIPVVGALRELGPYDKLASKDFETSMQSAKAEDTFTELGQTVGVLAHVFRLVPDKDPFRYGTSYLKELLISIPNIGFTQGQSDRASIARSVSSPEVIQGLAPADWLTYRVDPNRFRLGEGIGFSAIGEPYLNFGLVGVVVFFILLGFLLGRLEMLNLLEHPNLLVFSAVMYWHLARTVRDDFGNFLKPAIFALVVILIWRISTRFLAPKPNKG